MKEPKRQFKFRKVVLGFSIGIIFTLFVMYGIKTFYEEPRYEDFCDQQKYARPIYPGAVQQTEFCQELLKNITTPSCPSDVGYLNYLYDEKTGCDIPVCDTCSKDFEKANEKYNNMVFMISVVAGAIALIIGVIAGVEAVGSGLMFGGAMTIIIGTIRNWGHLGDLARFLILGLVLGALIWVGYKKLQD